MQTVLLTGATGYIGQFSVRHLLDRNYVVHAVTSKPFDEISEKNLIWHQANLLNADNIKFLMQQIRPTHLLHFAWYVEHGKFWNAVENLDWLRASLLLAEQFIRCGGERMVTAGTCAEYDWTHPTERFSEYETTMQPQTLYGAAKYALFLTLERLASVSGISYASGRIFFPFGANESPNRLLPSVVRSLLENKPAATSHGNQIRDFLYVEDIAAGFVELLDSDVRGAVNIASGHGVKLKEIIETVAEIIGKPELLRIGALPAPANEPAVIVADNSRLRDEVKFNINADLRDRLTETIDWWKKNL